MDLNPETRIFIESGKIKQLVSEVVVEEMRRSNQNISETERAKIVGSCETHVLKTFLDLSGNILGKRILVLGCGARNSYDNDVTDTHLYEPWYCRCMHKLGANVVGIDIQPQQDEPFENYAMDLSKKGQLNVFPSQSFDGIDVSQLMDSPLLHGILVSEDQRMDMIKELSAQIQRLFKDTGKIIYLDSELEKEMQI